MTVHRIRRNKHVLLQIPDDQRRLFLVLAHFMNETSILLRSFVWSYDMSSKQEAHLHGQVATSFYFERLLAGKLSEGWQLLHKHFFNKRPLSDLFERRATDAQKASLVALKRYFAKSNLIADVRNNFAFHYSPEALDEALPEMLDELDIYVETAGIANTLYYFAEALASHALLKAIEAQGIGDAMERLRHEVKDVTNHFIRFGQAFMSAIFKEHWPGIWNGESTVVDLGELPPFLEVRFPWFTDASGLLDESTA